MFLLSCPRCRRRALYGADRVRAVRNLFPGLILVELTCYRGHRVTVLTGWLASDGSSDGFPAGQEWPSRPDRRTAAPADPS